MGRKLGLDGRGRAKGLCVERSEIFAHRPRGIGWIDGGHIPFILAAGALLLDISADQAGIDGEALAADQSKGDARGHHALEDEAKDVAVAKLAMSEL
jgi:hypothetical protein